MTIVNNYSLNDFYLCRLTFSENFSIEEYLTLVENIFFICYQNKEVALDLNIFKKSSVDREPIFSIYKTRVFRHSVLKGSLKFKKFLGLLDKVYQPNKKEEFLTHYDTLNFRKPTFDSELERVAYIIQANKNIKAFLKKYDK